jgi:hypothetical protein
MDNFLKHLDQKFDTHKTGGDDAKKQRDELSRLTRLGIAKVRPLLERYVSELEKRGIKAALSVAGYMGDHLAFELEYGGGGYYGFQIEQGKVTPRSTGGGTHSSGGDGMGPSFARDVDLDAFEKLVQKTIEEFMTTAPKYGGFLKT